VLEERKGRKEERKVRRKMGGGWREREGGDC
jgi:hypothetical protein